MKTALMNLWALALLCAPLTASAQSHESSTPSPAPPAVAPAAPAADDDAFAWVDELFGLDTGDEFDLGAGGPEAGPLAAGGMMLEGEPGPGAVHGMRWEDDGDGGDRRAHRIVIGGPQGRRMMMRRGMAMRFAALDLTDAQRAKLRDIHEAAARKNVQRRADMQLARMDLHQLMSAETPSASAVNGQIDKLVRLQADGMKAHFDTFMQARAVLTPEQLKKLRSGPGPRGMGQEHHGED